MVIGITKGYDMNFQRIRRFPFSSDSACVTSDSDSASDYIASGNKPRWTAAPILQGPLLHRL